MKVYPMKIQKQTTPEHQFKVDLQIAQAGLLREWGKNDAKAFLKALAQRKESKKNVLEICQRILRMRERGEAGSLLCLVGRMEEGLCPTKSEILVWAADCIQNRY